MNNILKTLFIISLFVASMTSEARDLFGKWPLGSSPKEVGTRLCNRFMDTPHPNFSGAVAPTKEITYPEVCTWIGALRFSAVTRNKTFQKKLEQRFLPLFGAERHLQPMPDHVDHTVFGTVPLMLYAQTNNKAYYSMGMWYADQQWTMPLKTDKTEEYQALLDKGLSWQTRYWIDDMFMISAVQAQAYRVSKDTTYITRAGAEMVAYLEKIQQSNGLFFHAEDAPFFWGRGNGWMAAGMTELLSELPEFDPNRAKILFSYCKMMNALLSYQKEDGLWGQLVDDTSSWSESSGSAMFLYAMVKGVRKDWLDEEKFVPAVRKGWISLVALIDEKGDINSVCGGTNKNSDREFYLKRPVFKGDMHGQAPVLWCATAFLE